MQNIGKSALEELPPCTRILGCICLRRLRLKNIHPPYPVQSRAASKRKTIVIAEYDNPEEVAEPLRADYCIVVVDTADAAFKICTTCHVDLVVTRAVFLEGMNAVELVDQLAALPSPPRVCLMTPFRLAILNSLPGFPPPGVPILRKPIPVGLLVSTAGVLLKRRE